MVCSWLINCFKSCFRPEPDQEELQNTNQARQQHLLPQEEYEIPATYTTNLTKETNDIFFKENRKELFAIREEIKQLTQTRNSTKSKPEKKLLNRKISDLHTRKGKDLDILIIIFRSGIGESYQEYC